MNISVIMWVFEGVWLICAKFSFLHSLDVPIEMFANNLVALDQQTHVHCFQTQVDRKFQHVSVDAGTNNYLRCTKCDVQDRVHKHVIR